MVCGWCDAFEAKAQRAEVEAAAKYAPALDALRSIARLKCPDYCVRLRKVIDKGTCSRCLAREVLQKHGWTRGNNASEAK